MSESKPTQDWRKEFDERFNKPISDEAHRHLQSPTSKNVYYDNTELISFIEKVESSAVERTVAEMKLKPIVGTKVCCKCKKERPLTDFVIDASKKHTPKYACKFCDNARAREYQRKNLKKIRERKAKYDKENYLKRQETTRLLHKNDPVKALARKIYRRALVAGEIVRGVCEVCGSKKVHGHHEDYTKPLAVHWLCSVHHGERHRLLPDQANKDITK
jgi:uncharacterized protein with von Willebrand factor type A (vWA) domain